MRYISLPGMFLPVRMSETPTLRSGIRDYVYLIIGLFIVTLVGGILYFILGQMNSSGVQIPYSVNVLQYVFNFNSIIGLLFAMVIVIIAVVLIIRYLRGTQEGWE
jgi:type III secretory pathway component EscU